MNVNCIVKVRGPNHSQLGRHIIIGDLGPVDMAKTLRQAYTTDIPFLKRMAYEMSFKKAVATVLGNDDTPGHFPGEQEMLTKALHHPKRVAGIDPATFFHWMNNAVVGTAPPTILVHWVENAEAKRAVDQTITIVSMAVHVAISIPGI